MPFSPPRSVMRLLCPAKINLHLRVGPLRADGFHPLLTWMCTVGLFDTLQLDLSGARASAPRSEAAPPGRGTAPPGGTGKLAGAAAPRPDAGDLLPTVGIRISLQCEPPTVPADDRNLVVRVTKTWPSDLARDALITARLVKRTPVGAGLGGGSSDAARMALALNRLLPGSDGPLSNDALSAFAARFGSDVPFFLAGPSSICAGRGEIVRPSGHPRPAWVLLVLPDIMMPTPEVYRRFDALGLGRTEDIEQEPEWSKWAAFDAATLLPCLANDLEDPAFAIRPELGRLRADIEQMLGRPVRMSGSGSSLFTLFDLEEEARAAAQQVFKHIGPPGRVEAVELAPRILDDLGDK